MQLPSVPTSRRLARRSAALLLCLLSVLVGGGPARSVAAPIARAACATVTVPLVRSLRRAATLVTTTETYLRSHRP